ncbi:hypothetical protein XNC3_2500035 [Xenorhabdus nematophila F1]|nr:hypothetical protein XNC3_2500035 [Xenorhabdus nematophila F1]CEE91689.1 hypothetical protein XNA1_2330014 [Xenorhabdus nematophila str. Anatoliense]CEF32221.1 hypothetical protein XNW1_4280004 [Xenorhabdus nematophila str. Websteri]CEK22325.1 protein of unknown function [Xenorhabdus nematophila AN6/1]CEE95551.1 hypothetical protein XNA1_550014 [Xenorhabdus nematophila str. Anatoliense]
MKLHFPKDEITDVIRARRKVFWIIGLFTAFINLLVPHRECTVCLF